MAIMALSGALGFFVLGANYALYGAAASYYPSVARGRGSGAAVAWGRLGSVAGPLVGGFLLQGGASTGKVVSSMTPFAVAALIGVFLLTLLPKPKH
jgi:AAHS family 3-hydroxyphenylpropionic acid transporter